MKLAAVVIAAVLQTPFGYYVNDYFVEITPNGDRFVYQRGNGLVATYDADSDTFIQISPPRELPVTHTHYKHMAFSKIVRYDDKRYTAPILMPPIPEELR